MGPAPTGRHTIDRKDNNGHYESDNCRWATRKEQARNTCTNRLITWRGETLCLAEWAERLGVGVSTLHHRLKRSTLERAMRPGLIVRGERIDRGAERVRLRDEAARLGIDVRTVRSRMRRGLTLEEALTRPNRYRREPVFTGQAALSSTAE